MKDIEEMASAVEEATSTGEIYDLLYRWEGKEREVMRVLARHAKHWDEGLLFAVLRSDIGAYEPLEYANLPEWAHSRIARWSLNRLYSEAANAPLSQAKITLMSLAQKGMLPLDSTEAKELVEIAFPKSKMPKSMSPRLVAAIEVLLSHPDLDTPLLDRIGEAIAELGGTKDKIKVVLHPMCSMPLARKVITGHGRPPEESMDALWKRTLLRIDHYQVERLLRVERYRQDPILREQFLNWAHSHNEAKLFAPLVADGLDDCAELFRILSGMSQKDAAAVLAAHGPRVAPHLKREDVEPLLQAKDQNTRLAAIGVVGQIGSKGILLLEDSNTLPIAV